MPPRTRLSTGGRLCLLSPVAFCFLVVGVLLVVHYSHRHVHSTYQQHKYTYEKARDELGTENAQEHKERADRHALYATAASAVRTGVVFVVLCMFLSGISYLVCARPFSGTTTAAKPMEEQMTFV